MDAQNIPVFYRISSIVKSGEKQGKGTADLILTLVYYSPFLSSSLSYRAFTLALLSHSLPFSSQAQRLFHPSRGRRFDDWNLSAAAFLHQGENPARGPDNYRRERIYFKTSKPYNTT